MDWMKILTYCKKYRWPALILLIGLVLLLLPGKNAVDQTTPVINQTQDNILSLEEALSVILSTVQGAGKVRVMLSLASGEETLYQSDTNITEGGSGKHDTVIVSDAQRNELGLIKQINPPVYKGAIIVCQGADSPAVRLNLMEAVSKVTGLTSDKISILKMN
jgi:stage III sporulation protein AG